MGLLNRTIYLWITKRKSDITMSDMRKTTNKKRIRKWLLGIMVTLLSATQALAAHIVFMATKINLAIYGTVIGPYFFMGMGAASLWAAIVALLVYMYYNRDLLL
jgi:hypothetical protein